MTEKMVPKLEKRRATEKELNALRNYHEDVGFREYPLLKEDCKRHLIGVLDVKTASRLQMCSKQENRLVAEIPAQIFGIAISYFVNEHNLNETCVVRIFGPEKRDQCEFRFKRKNTNDKEKTSILKRGWTVFEWLLEKCRFEVEELVVMRTMMDEEIQYPSDLKLVPLSKVRKATIGVANGAQLEFWLQKIPERLDRLILTNHAMDISADQVPQILNARELWINGPCHVTDDQFLGLTARRVFLASTPLLTRQGVNRYLRQWQSGNGAGGELEKMVLRGMRWSAFEMSHGLRVDELTIDTWLNNWTTITCESEPPCRVAFKTRYDSVLVVRTSLEDVDPLDSFESALFAF